MLKITVTKKEEGVLVIAPVGPIDSSTYMDLEAKIDLLLKKPVKIIMIDMGGVDYISSMGLGVIFKTKKAVESNKGNLIMINLQPQIQMVFDIIKALPSINVFANMEEVDNYLSNIQRKEKEKIKGEDKK